MYVKRLIEFAEEHPNLFPPLGFKEKPIDWIVDINDGELIFNRAERKSFIVPTVARSGSSIEPMLIVDKPDYVFGWSADHKDAERSTERHQAYVRQLEEYIDTTGDQDVKALLDALEKPIDYPEKMKSGDFLVFRIRSQYYLHDSEKVRHFWLYLASRKCMFRQLKM